MLKIAEWYLCIFRFRRMRLAAVPMRRAAVILLLMLGPAELAEAQISDATLNSMGLQRMWRGQIQMPLEEGRIVSTHLWTNPSERRTFAELTLPLGMGSLAMGSNRTLRASADRLDATGKPIGIEAAKKEVETRVARLLGRASGIPAVEVTVPLVYFVLVTSDGYVQTYDAETGEKLWSNAGGSPRFPAAPASVSDMGVAVAQGQYLYLFDWKTGKELSRREMTRASTAGVALIDNIAFVSSLSGQLMAFNLSEAPSLNNWSYRLYGRAVSAPAVAHRPNKLVAFASEKGLVTVFSADEKIETWFNFEARAPLAGPISFHGAGLYCGDVTGQVTKVALDRLGLIQWRLMIGDALGAPPIVHDNTVYLTNALGIMMAADDRTGYPIWQSPVARVRSLLTATKDKIFCRSLTGRLLAIDASTGDVVAQTAPSILHADVVNHLNDRVYLVNATGEIVCLRPQGPEHALPEFHEALPVPTETPKAKTSEEETPAAMETTTESASSDPFAVGTVSVDPIGAPATPPATTEADPFATPSTGSAEPSSAGAVNPF